MAAVRRLDCSLYIIYALPYLFSFSTYVLNKNLDLKIGIRELEFRVRLGQVRFGYVKMLENILIIDSNVALNVMIIALYLYKYAFATESVFV